MKYYALFIAIACFFSCNNIRNKISDSSNQDSLAQIQKIKELAKSAYIKAYTEVQELKTAIEWAEEGIIPKSKILNDYNSSMGLVMGRLKTFPQVKRRIDTAAKAYIQYKFNMAAAEIARGKAAELSFEAESLKEQDTLKRELP